MTGILYEEQSFGTFLLVTILLGGGAAWLSGRAIAMTWRPYLQLVAYVFLLAAFVRFLHFALFEGTLLSLHYYLVDLVVLQIAGWLGFRLKRVKQMVTQYRWIYERAGPFGWRAKG
ncbi:DUF6867 family protein [Lutibaculum baratangense]|uniref:DUF6867 domain-containing protein n=1 Tax=Lutibaculum baratangense AMV1 TaxID=631454 RepID=V4RGR8_9HYPH|nr:hypothetical protein [Lutibaculum baratangense]ESR22460.1 hypothetical protein N177_4190 [Lutibaculum baratangense AMV1]